MAIPPLASTGIGSGLDVNAIVDKLMAIERRPLTALARQQANFEAKISAYGSLKSALAALKTAVAAFAANGSFRSMSSTLSDTAVATAAAGGGAVPGTHSLEVTALAQAHKIASDGFASSTETVGSGTLTFAFGTFAGGAFTANPDAPAKAVTIGAGQSSLAGIRDAVNAAKIGVTASIVDDGSAAGQRLVFTSSSGAALSMNVTVADDDGNHLDASGLSRLAYDPAAAAGSGRNMTQKVAAQDAALTIDGIAVTSASNVVVDALEGVTITLAKTNAGSPATLAVSRDTAAGVKAMEALVKAYNELQTTINKLTRFDADKRTASVLTGDSAVRSIQSRLRSLITGTQVTAAGATITSLAQAGVKTNTDGSLTLDSVKFTSLLNSDFAGLDRVFSDATTATDSQVFVTSAGSAIREGEYALQLTQIATRGTLVGSAAADLHIKSDNDTLTATVNGVTATVTLTRANYASASTLAAEVQSKLNASAAFVAANTTVSVTASAGVLTATSGRYGSTSTVAFSGTAAAALMGGAPTATAGQDVAGTIGGHAATGTGQVLTGGAGTPVDGLRLTITGGAPGARGLVHFANGLGKRLDQLLADFIAADGLVEARTEGAQATVKSLDKRMTALEARLELVEAAYRRQYVALDATIAQMSATSQYLAQQLANLPKPYDDDK